MLSRLLHRRETDWRSRAPDDEGSALLVAVMVTGICLAISLLGLQVAMSGTRGSGVDRQRVLAVNAAEAGVDAAYVAITQGGAQPPCALPATSVRSGPDTATYATSISYFDDDEHPLGCTAGGVVGVPASALIRSTASAPALAGASTRGERTMEAAVDLVPARALNKAIFADGSLTFTNNASIRGHVGTDADLYSTGNFTCANNQDFAGNIHSQGSITISSRCGFAAGVWAAGSATTSAGSNGTVAGYVKAGGGAMALSGVAVSGNLYAAGNISYSGCATTGRCFPNSSPGAPPVTPFPIIRADAAALNAWTAAGYTVITDNACATVKNRVIDTYARRGTPTLLVTACAVNFAGDKTIALSNDLAIFASGGFSSSLQVSFQSSSVGARRLLHWVVPFTGAARPCAAPGITTSQQFGHGADVDMFLYASCAISFSNSSNHIGQVYGGSDVTINNQFNLTYRPVPTHGIDPGSLPTLSYTPSVVYKRETR